jgi:HK97 gp10 family phage protein
MITMRVSGLKEFQKGITNAQSGNMQKHFSSAMEDSVRTIASRAKRNAPSFRGDLQISIKGIVERWNKGIVGTPRSMRYARYVEEGTRPHYVPARALFAWAKFKGKGVGFAYAVAKTIEKKGSKAHPFLKPAFESEQNQVLKFFNRAIELTLKDIGRHGK